MSGGTPPTDGQNFTGIENEEYDSRSSEALQAAGEDSCELWNQAEQALFEGADAVPVSDANTPYFLSGAEASTDGWLHVPIPTSIRVVE